MSTLAYAVADSATMLRRQLRHMLRYASVTVFLIGMPIVFLLLFVYVFGGTLGAGLGGPAGGRGGTPAGGLLVADRADDPGRAGPQGTLADLEAGDLALQHPLGGGAGGADLLKLGGPLPHVRLLLAGVLLGCHRPLPCRLGLDPGVDQGGKLVVGGPGDVVQQFGAVHQVADAVGVHQQGEHRRGGVVDVGGAGAAVDHRLLGVDLQLGPGRSSTARARVALAAR